MGNCNETNGQEQGNMVNNGTSTDEKALSYSEKTRSENKINYLSATNDRGTRYQEMDSIKPLTSHEDNPFSRSKKYRRIKGKNGDFTIVDEHGCVVAESLGL